MRKVVIIALGMSMLAGCATTAPTPVDSRNSALTQGNVQMNLKVGETSKAQVLDVFGAPNITTRDGAGAEVLVIPAACNGAAINCILELLDDFAFGRRRLCCGVF